MKTLAFLTTLISLVILCGCGASVPSEHDGRQSLQEQISKPSSKVKLLSFHKTNGKGDDQHYTIEFDAEVEITADGLWDGHEYYVVYPHMGAYMYDLPTPVKAGQRRKIEGSVDFEKTEKGWRSLSANWGPPRKM